MIGYRYRCPTCLHPKSKKPTVTFCSWDSRILAMLDHNLQAEFPAQLTCRSGISCHALAFMRTCFQHGLGSKQFSTALCVQHLQLYDELHLQYLHHLAPQKDLSAWQGKTFKPFLAFDDRRKMGFMDSHQMHSGCRTYMTTLLSTTRMTLINILRLLRRSLNYQINHASDL
jgi:hypothetical protein